MKIICSDYDGTLNHGGITEKKIEAIKKWQKKGNLFCIVSGRQKNFFCELKEKGIPIDFFLGCNGAVITDKDYNTVSDVRCEKNIGNELTEFLFSLGCPFVFFCGDEFLRIKNESFPEEKGIDYTPDIKFSSFNQISTALDSFEKAAVVTEKVREKFGEYLNPLQNGTCIDIVPAGMDKARGIYILLDKADGKYEDVIAVGDNINDEAMIKEFYSYAMENGVEEIKKIADNITVSIEELIEREI
ncbi:MAG: HAD-IIB family hydrolase [Ruminococcaceae bacterium]|nr:HAD-IIB family hydrolase [Oscillospiraceae bacterium]